jgi:hypothetical protein
MIARFSIAQRIQPATLRIDRGPRFGRSSKYAF